MKRVGTFESLLAEAAARDWRQCADCKHLHLKIGHYCNRDPRALAYYLKRYLDDLSVEVKEVSVQKGNVDHCWETCFKGFPFGAALSQCKNCVGYRLSQN